MKSRIFVLMSTITVFAALGIRIRVAAQGQQESKAAQPHRYTVTALSTLGGTSGIGNGISNKGWVAGGANLTGDTTQHATLWRYGVITDLGTLGGPNSFVNWPVKDDRGVIAGFAETSTPDPLGERFCAAAAPVGFNTGLTCLGLLWQNGVIAPLPPLPGGNNSQASGVNNRGQVVGYAENSTHDPTCIAPQVLQYEAVMWRPKQGQIQELPPLPGDLDGAATAINDKGQVAGCSGVCGTAAQNGCVHAVVWENGSPTNISDLGGTVNAAVAINNRGQVLGLSVIPDNTFRSFLGENGVITDFGTLPGDVCGGFPCVLTIADGINDKGQVVGHSCDITDTYCSAWLWQNGVMTDLNTLIPPGSSLFLAYAGDINDRGEITGQAIDQITGEAPAFLAIPCDKEHADDEGCQAMSQVSVRVERPRVVLPENVREQLQRRMQFGRFRGQFAASAAQVEQEHYSSQPVLKNVDTLGDASTIAERSSDAGSSIADTRPDANSFDYLGNCEVDRSTKRLTGICVGRPGSFVCRVSKPRVCPPGAPAKNPGYSHSCAGPVLVERTCILLGP